MQWKDRLIWLALVVSASSALGFANSLVMLGVAAALAFALAAALGMRTGPFTVIAAASATFLIIGAVTYGLGAELRDPSLLECGGIMNGVATIPDEGCYESAKTQLIQGTFPAILILFAGVPFGAIRALHDEAAKHRRAGIDSTVGDAAERS